MKRKIPVIFLACLILFPSRPLLAGTFKVTPVKLFLDSKTRTTAVRVTNEGEEKATVQLDAVKWSQDGDGKDLYGPTGDIVFFPKIMTMGTGEEKIIRVGYEGPPPGETERAYRLYVEELPVSRPGETAVRMVLKIGIPIYVEPDRKKTEATIEKADLSGGNLRVRVKNGGNSHVTIGNVKITGYGGSGVEVFSRDIGGGNLLAGVSRTISRDLTDEECAKARSIRVEANAEGLSLKAAVDISPAMCERHGPVGEPGKKQAQEEKPGGKGN